MNDLQTSQGIFDKGRTAFNPVSIVEIQDISDAPDRRLVDVAAHHAVKPMQLGDLGYGILEPADIFDGVLHGVLQPR
jgi:hypothetical protein